VELDLDALVARRRQVLADEVRADRKLAMAPVDENRELHPRRPPELEQRVYRGPDGAARIEDVVHEHDGPTLDRDGNRRRTDHRSRTCVVAMEADVERSYRELDPAALEHEHLQTARERNAAPVDA